MDREVMTCEIHEGVELMRRGGGWVCPKCEVELAVPTEEVTVFDCPKHGPDTVTFSVSQNNRLVIGPVCARCLDEQLKGVMPGLTARTVRRPVQDAGVDGTGGKQ